MWPRLASSLLLYRFHRLPAARAKARVFAGARGLAAGSQPWASAAAFPWESAFSGAETCPTYSPNGEGEIHISGDVAVAVWQHFQATRDAAWLEGVGFPILAGVADFYLSRALADSPGAAVSGANGRLYFAGAPPPGADLSGDGPLGAPTQWPLHIRGVIAATEFYTNVSDNALTNGVARLALRYAARAARVLGRAEGEYAHWDDAAARIALPRAPAPAEVAGALGESATVTAYFEGFSLGGEGGAGRQPVQLLDVPMLHDMLGLENGEPGAAGGANVARRRAAAAAAAEADVRHYLRAFEGGAAFAYALNSLAAARIGELAVAHSFFARAHAAFVHGPFQVWTEYPGGSGCPNFVSEYRAAPPPPPPPPPAPPPPGIRSKFLTPAAARPPSPPPPPPPPPALHNTAAGAAALLQAVVVGYAGLQLVDGGVSLRPTALPEGARRLRLRALSLRGLRFSVDIDAARVRVTREDEDDDDMDGDGVVRGGVSESALLRTARRLAVEGAASAARGARGWL